MKLPFPRAKPKLRRAADGTPAAVSSGQLVVAGLTSACIYFSVVFLVFGAWVHYFYAGKYAGPLMISTMFGVSSPSVEAGAEPIYLAPIAGWDGQFYYTQSNDPFLLDDYSASTLFDSVSYRYQRNALPILAWAVSRASGQTVTTPLVYFVVQLAIMSIGFGSLVAFLKLHQIHWGWACVWGFYGGVLRPFAHGLPDPTADSLLLLSTLAAISGRLGIYAVVCSLLCLCRESYAAPAAVIWLMTVLGKLDWRGKWPYWLRIVVAGLPGAIVLGWALYVAHQTDTGLLSGSRSIPWGGLVDWPFKAYLSCLWLDIRASDENDAIYATSCALCIAAVLLINVRRLHCSKLAWGIMPHLILMSMTGWIVWEAGVGFFKNTSSVVLLGVMLLSVSPTRWLRAALLFTLLASVHYVYRVDFRHQGFLPPVTVSALDAKLPPLELVPVSQPIEFSSDLRLLDVGKQQSDYHGLFRWFHRIPQEYTIRVTNTSQATWHASIPGAGAVSLGRQLLSGEDVLHEDRSALYKTLNPGDELDIRFTVPIQPNGWWPHTVRVGLVQDGNAWFFWHDEKQKLEFTPEGTIAQP